MNFAAGRQAQKASVRPKSARIKRPPERRNLSWKEVGFIRQPPLSSESPNRFMRVFLHPPSDPCDSLNSELGAATRILQPDSSP